MNFPCTLKLRIDWSEQDLFGHVNNVMFMKYIQAARINYWEAVGIYQDFPTTGIGPMLVAISCQYKKPLHFPGSIVVHTRMKFIKTTSFSLHHQVRNMNNELCAEAEDVMVVFDFNKNEKVQFPDDIRKKVEDLEGREI
jgi:acyl-CoA thioester hydrolase